MSALVRKPAVFLGLVGLLVLIPFLVRLVAETAVASAPATTAAPSPTDLRVALIRAGLDARSLAAAGVAPAQVGTLVANAQAATSGLATPLAALDDQAGQARSVRDALERKVRSGLASPAEIDQLQDAEQSLAVAIAQRQAAIDAIFSAVTAPLTPSQRTILLTIRANREREFSVEFLTVNRTDAEWVALRDALSNERISAKHGETANAACQALLAGARANTSVAAASSACEANLVAIAAAWDVSTGE